MTNKKIPVYVGDFSDYDIRNIPMSLGMRMALVNFLRDLLDSQEKFETIFAVPFSDKYRRLCRTLLIPLTTNLKLTENREPTRRAIADYEKNTRVIVLPDYRESITANPVQKKNLNQSTGTSIGRLVQHGKTMVQAASLLTLIYVLVFICSII